MIKSDIKLKIQKNMFVNKPLNKDLKINLKFELGKSMVLTFRRIRLLPIVVLKTVNAMIS